jgi:hypothetical protein
MEIEGQPPVKVLELLNSVFMWQSYAVAKDTRNVHKDGRMTLSGAVAEKGRRPIFVYLVRILGHGIGLPHKDGVGQL